MASPLAIAINFLEDFGFFDVVLPFLLVFTVVFAILEKTKIFGVEEQKPKRNINSMVAFSVALFVVAASNIVGIIRAALPTITLVLIIIVCFLLLAGSFISGEEEFSFKNTKWKVFLTVVIFIAVIVIFLNSVSIGTGETWLEVVGGYIIQNWATGPLVPSIILLAVIIGVIYYVMRPTTGRSATERSD